MAKSIEVTANRSRHFVHWTRGKLLVGITRSVSPSDSDENLQPFAFLDYFDTKGSSFSDFGLRDRSNFATLTHLMEGDVRYENTNGASGRARSSVEISPLAKTQDAHR